MITELRYWSRNLVREFGFLQKYYGDTGATYSETHALLELGRIGSMEVSELAKLLNIDKSVASRIMSGMHQKSWVTIARTADKRRKQYVLAKQGKLVLNKVETEANHKVKRAVESLTADQQKTVQEGLALYTKALKQARIRNEFTIRKIKKQDNKALANLVRKSLKDMGFEGPGTAATDESLDYLSELFTEEKTVYYVAEKDDKILGGAGIIPLAKGPSKTCELVRMFISADARGMGLGQVLIEEVLNAAKTFGYNYCYLETTEKMQAAQRLYLNNDFEYLKNRMGDTGHFTCNVLMGKKL